MPHYINKDNLKDPYTRMMAKTRRVSSGCVEWQGSLTSGGYGSINIKDKKIAVHRLSYQHHKGKIPAKDVVRHICNNKICVNPEHLIIGTHSDNMRDIVQSNTHNKGYIPLADSDVVNIRKRYSRGESLSSLAKKYNRSISNISQVVSGKSYAHLPILKRDDPLMNNRKIPTKNKSLIIKQLKNGVRPSVIARQYNVAQSAINQLVNRSNSLKKQKRTRKPSDEAVRFISKVKKLGNGCWEWMAYRHPNGYGQFYFRGKTEKAHRVAFKIFKNDIAKNVVLMHSCDNPACVNPKHLSVGTRSENMKDAVAKGRNFAPSLSGQLNPNAKFSNRQIKTIRMLNREKELSGSAIGKIYGVDRSIINKILSGKSYGDVPD